MQYVLKLSKENPPLCRAEAKAIVKIDSFDENILVTKFFSASKKDEILNGVKKLSYTKECYELIKIIEKHSSDKDEIMETLEKISWNNYYEENFAFKIISLSTQKKGLDEKEIASLIHSKLENPIVQLNNPKTLFLLIKTNDRLYVTKQVWTNKENHNERKTSLKVANHPIALKPILQRAMVNLAGLESGTIIDPFCGTGGILIESMLTGLTTIGYDIKSDIQKLAKKDFEELKLTDYKLEKKDSTKLVKEDVLIPGENVAIVTEFPYGRNTSIEMSKLEELYTDFFNNLTSIVPLKTGMRVICSMPDDIEFEEIVKDWRIETKFTHYIHGSLSINILVLKR